MTCLTTIRTEVSTPVLDFHPAYHDAINRALAGARYSYFDQQIIRTDDGCCWATNEAAYQSLTADMADRIVATVSADRSDES